MNPTHHGPEMAPEALYFKTDVSPEVIFKAIGSLRKEARDEIDRLIQFLDQTDDYVCRELEDAVDDGPIDDNELEPSLCGLDADPRRHQGGDGCGWLSDRELDDSDDEPSLGSIENHPNGYTDSNVTRSHEHWAGGNTDEREGDGCADDREGDELQHGGEGVTENDEPSLCGIHADGLAGGDRDLEADLGSFDRMFDQTKSTRVTDKAWCGRTDVAVMDGEVQ
ncbi:hypothetical protein [Tardiphaga robiniae]|uniref:hypothetical protein n=1 Tax=Tardiphaga robiniae TaxID=943830 RepID=UPI001585D66A|nr:hypothetical protein [Tardiphaga robiniae]NUU40361.1 hypothetical protein [Tardiphaga robiniae]